MRTILGLAIIVLAFRPATANAYIEVPHTLGRCCNEASTIVLMEVTRVSAEKNLIIYKKIADIKGKHPVDEIKHNIGKKGFHEREWKNIMQWAEVGKKAVFMYNGDASETCIGTYWYQAYREGEWWGMSHAEPFLLRTYYGDPVKLSELCTRILKGEQVVTTCLADGDKNQLHLRKGKLQRLKASNKLVDYNPKRDFIGWGADGEDIEEFKTAEILKESSPDWKFLPAKAIKGEEWIQPAFDDAAWRKGQAPIGYGEVELQKRKGTLIEEKGEAFVFRRAFEVPAEMLATKDATFRLGIASDDTGTTWLNGTPLEKDPAPDHEFAYWNHEIDIPVKLLKPGRNVIAILVANKVGSSDLYLDAAFTASVPLPRKKKDPATVVAKNNTPTTSPTDPTPKPEPRDPNAMVVDKGAKTITINCSIAPRKLAHLDQSYPIEVIATWATPRGQKAHETVLNFKGLSPSDVAKALTDELGLKPGKPAYGEAAKAVGPEVRILLEFPGADGKPQRVPFDKLLTNKDGKPIPEFKWYFTGSIMKEPDPEKPIQVYGADMTGTLLSLFPVTDCCVFQTQLTMKEEAQLKLDTNASLLPKEGTPAKLIIQVP